MKNPASAKADEANNYKTNYPMRYGNVTKFRLLVSATTVNSPPHQSRDIS